MRFLHPWILLAIPFAVIAALIAFVMLSHRENRLSRLAGPSVLRAAGLASGGIVSRLQIALLAAGALLLAIAAARPQWGRSGMAYSSRGASLLVALDVSRSMLATDVRPNRLERAKVDILDLISDLRGDRCGLLVFRGKGVMLCPLTADYAFLRQAIDGVSVDSAPRGETDIADALEKALEALASSAEDNCAIVLISDGEDLAGRAVKAAQKAGERNIPIFTVGIGDPAGADVPAADGSGAMKFGGKAVRSRLTEQTLREIATATGGAYIPLATAGTAGTTLGAIYRQHLSRLAKREYDEMLENRYVERYQLFLFPALVLLLAAASLSCGRLARRRHIPAAALAICSLLLAPSLHGQTAPSPRATYNQAVDLYNAGDFTNAAATLLPLSIRNDMPEAVELFGAAEFAKSGDVAIATNVEERMRLLESAAASFQLALAAGAAEPERVARNLARATSTLPSLREAARQAEIESKYASTPPPALVSRMLEAQRDISAKTREAADVVDARERIEAFENLAARQHDIADMNTVVAKSLAQSLENVTNEEARASFQKLIDATAKTIGSATDALENIDASAAMESDRAGLLLLEAWKPMSEPPAYVQEAILCETNAAVAANEPRWRLVPDADVALDTMRWFSQTFPHWAEEFIKNDEQQRAQSGSTNAPAFTQENADKIMELMEPLMFLLEDNAKFSGSDEAQRTSGAREALALLEQIRDLLPKQNPPPQQSQDQQQQQQEQQQDQQQQQEQQQQEQQQEEQEEKEQPKPEEEDKELPEDVEEALRRAIQREREHEAEKQKQRRELPLPPNSRDW